MPGFRRNRIAGGIAAGALLSLAAGALCLVSGRQSPAVYQVERTTLLAIRGRVEVQPVSSLDFSVIQVDRPLLVGDRVRTGRDSNASIIFLEGSSMELEPESDVTVEQLHQGDKGEESIVVVRQNAGTTWTRVGARPVRGGRLKVSTPFATLSSEDGEFLARVETDGRATVNTSRGSVTVLAQGTRQTVGAGFRAVIAPQQPPGLPERISPPLHNLQVAASGPVDLFLKDSTGRSWGVHPLAGAVAAQIPEVSYRRAGSEPLLVTVPDPGEWYHLVIRGREGGANYEVSLRLENSRLQKGGEDMLAGRLSAGESHAYWVGLDTNTMAILDSGPDPELLRALGQKPFLFAKAQREEIAQGPLGMARHTPATPVPLLGSASTTGSDSSGAQVASPVPQSGARTPTPERPALAARPVPSPTLAVPAQAVGTRGTVAAATPSTLVQRPQPTPAIPPAVASGVPGEGTPEGNSEGRAMPTAAVPSPAPPTAEPSPTPAPTQTPLPPPPPTREPVPPTETPLPLPPTREPQPTATDTPVPSPTTAEATPPAPTSTSLAPPTAEVIPAPPTAEPTPPPSPTPFRRR